MKASLLLKPRGGGKQIMLPMSTAHERRLKNNCQVLPSNQASSPHLPLPTSLKPVVSFHSEFYQQTLIELILSNFLLFCGRIQPFLGFPSTSLPTSLSFAFSFFSVSLLMVPPHLPKPLMLANAQTPSLDLFSIHLHSFGDLTHVHSFKYHLDPGHFQLKFPAQISL